ncbi:MAG: hypothetical protein AAFX05_12205 [Planctomycetota bacterium]
MHSGDRSLIGVLLVVLVACTVINLAVAMVIAARAQPAPLGTGFINPPQGSKATQREWQRVASHIQTVGMPMLREYDGDGLHVMQCTRVGSLAVIESATRVQAGWPMRSFTCTFVMTRTLQSVQRNQYAATVDGPGPRTGLPIPFALTDTQEFRRFPILPAWPGFFVNTALYAGVLLVPLLLVRQARRVQRRGVERCVRCGYDVAGVDMCPECGTPVDQAQRMMEQME